MWYVLEGFDGPQGLALRPSLRAAHLARLETLVKEGRLLVVGPCPAIDALDPGPAGFSGSLLIAEFPSMGDAEAWIADDPYAKGGVFESTRVRPFNRVLP